MDDQALVRIVDAAAAEAVRLGGDRVACRPGCTPCCLGPFAITPLDAARLREGLRAIDGPRAHRVRARAAQYSAAIAPVYPGDSVTGALHDEELLPGEWEETPCPALDPESGRCDVYEWRPLTCRLFGPAMRFDSGPVGACELCYEGASDDEIAAVAVSVSYSEAEGALVDATGQPSTIVAFALSREKETR